MIEVKGFRASRQRRWLSGEIECESVRRADRYALLRTQRDLFMKSDCL
jgi:hypothetical protein